MTRFYDHNEKPRVVCLCGSTRFADEFHAEGWRLTLEGVVVLTIGVVKSAVDGHAAEALGDDVADQLDALHLHKIDMADSVHVINVGGYIGDSTRAELVHAIATGKPITFLEPREGEDYLQRNAHEMGQEIAVHLTDLPARDVPAATSGFDYKIIKADLDAATRGPWRWNQMGGAGGKHVLWGEHGTRPIVLDVCPGGPRKGDFRVRRDGLMIDFDPDHPDARLIEAAPVYIDVCLREIAELRRRLTAATDREGFTS